MDVLSLKIFLDVARRNSFSEVARDRNVSPSTISRTIATLEEELGARLFQRSTRHLALTEAGADYFSQVESSVGEIEQAGINASEWRGVAQGTLRITAPVDFGQLAIVPLLPVFAMRYPEIKFDLLFSDAMMDLLAERIDIAVRLGPPSDYSYIGTKLFDEGLVVCASQSYLKRHSRPQQPRDVGEHNCMHFSLPAYTQWCFHKGNGRETINIQSNLQVSNSVVLKNCALGDMGLALLPRWAVWQEIENGQLVDLFPDYQVLAPDVTTAAWLMYPSRNHLPQKVSAFIDFMKTEFNHWPKDYKLPRAANELNS